MSQITKYKNNGTVYDIVDANAARRSAVEQLSALIDNVDADFRTSSAVQTARIVQLEEKLDELMERLEDIFSVKVDGAYLQDGMLFLTSGDDDVAGPLGPFAGGGGGGGGGGTYVVTDLTWTPVTEWTTANIATGARCPISFNWTSSLDGNSTGNGTLYLTVNNVQKLARDVAQGDVTIDVGPYLASGKANVRLKVEDSYGNSVYRKFVIYSNDLSLSMRLNNSVPYTQAFRVYYTPVTSSNVDKTIHLMIDGVEQPTTTTNVSGVELFLTVPAQTHGAHTIEMWATCELNGEELESDHVKKSFAFAVGGDNTPIIIYDAISDNVQQYDTVPIVYKAYTANSMTTPISIYEGETLITTMDVDRNVQTYAYHADTAGNQTVTLQSGSITVTIPIAIEAVIIDAEVETEGLQLSLNARGRSNSQTNRNTWTYGNISAQMTGFVWGTRDGWLNDSDGVNILRTCEDARVYVPFTMFEEDLKQTGATFEVEFSTTDVIDYSAPIISCWSNNRGFKITPKDLIFRSAQKELTLPYKDNEHITFAFTVYDQGTYRLVLFFIDGVICSAMSYDTTDQIIQQPPVGISIGSSLATVDIYSMRFYNRTLSIRQVLTNYIADINVGSTKLEAYLRNNIYTPAGTLTDPTLLPIDLPYEIIECSELSQYKGDKKTVSGSFTDNVTPANSFTFTGCQNNTQGTSSQRFPTKNFDMQHKDGFEMNDGSHADNYKIFTTSIPFNRFVLKADFASSESANNTCLCMFYNDTVPYKVPEQVENPYIRQAIEGRPIVLFWYNTDTGVMEFQGKYNFNLPKRAPGPYGFHDDTESWEFERNNSLNMWLKDNDFTTLAYDAENDMWYPAWYDDWEARWPDDTYRDITKLNEFVSWVKSTDREAATNEVFDNSITYTISNLSILQKFPEDNTYTYTTRTVDGTTVYDCVFTCDSPTYRLAKFACEFDDYCEREAFLYYYLYTEFLLMIDSRAKNLFIGFQGSYISNT